MELHVFSGLTGAHVCRLSASACSWSDSLNECGSLQATVADGGGDEVAASLSPYRSVAAAVEGSEVLHAGYVTQVSRDRAAGTIEVTAGGGATVLSKRLVLNYRLNGSWRDGQVLIDEDAPPAEWVLTANGSYSDLIRALILETKKWGPLPIVAAAATGGNKTRTWRGWDMATVLDRIQDIGDLENGPEWRFDPVLDDDWRLTFRQVTSADGGELVGCTWRWNTVVPGQGVALSREDSDGEDMASECYAIGGREEDRLLVARATGGAIAREGWPVLQKADTAHQQVSILATLRSYARAALAAGDSPQLCADVEVPASWRVRVGDHADVRVGPGAGGVLALKVTDVRGSMGSATQTVGCRARGS